MNWDEHAECPDRRTVNDRFLPPACDADRAAMIAEGKRLVDNLNDVETLLTVERHKRTVLGAECDRLVAELADASAVAFNNGQLRARNVALEVECDRVRDAFAREILDRCPHVSHPKACANCVEASLAQRECE